MCTLDPSHRAVLSVPPRTGYKLYTQSVHEKPHNILRMGTQLQDEAP